jgi:uncharacterized protein (TIGR02246 family)
MFAHNSFRLNSIWAAAVVAVAGVAGACAACAEEPQRTQIKIQAAESSTVKTADAQSDDEATIRALAEDYEKNFNSGNAKAVAEAWAEDGTFTNEQGRQFQGRQAIEKEFAAIFADNAGARIIVNVESIKFISPDVAVENGTTEVDAQGGPKGQQVKYNAVQVKRDGKWRLYSVNEARPSGAAGAERLASLAFLVGEWKADLGQGKTYRTTCQWLPGKTFLSRTFSVSNAEGEISSGTQIIGFDPVLAQIVSWTFDSSGGFGHEMWENRGGEWRIEASSVLPDGATSLSTNLLAPLDDNTFTWRSVERSVNEQLLPDTTEVRVKRVSQ